MSKKGFATHTIEFDGTVYHAGDEVTFADEAQYERQLSRGAVVAEIPQKAAAGSFKKTAGGKGE